MIVIVNNTKKNTASFLKHLTEEIKKTALTWYIVDNYPRNGVDKDLLRKAKLLLILGGDGTVLNALQESDNSNQFILAVNFGTLGYISDVGTEESLILLTAISSVIANPETLKSIFAQKKAQLRETGKKYNLIFDRRAMISCRTNTNHSKTLFALNEIAIKPAQRGRPMYVYTSMGGIPLCNFLADGAIVATPTGSTAYSLSAAGPIVSSNVNALIFNAICPHSISMKPLVVHGDETITITTSLDSYIYCDGSETLFLKKGEELHIEKKKHSPIFLHSSKYNRYKHLKKKLNWG